MARSGNLISPSPSLTPAKGATRIINPSVGSGSRPGPSRIKIETTAPSDPITLGRSTPGALK